MMRFHPILFLTVAICFFSPLAVEASGIWRKLGRFNDSHVYFTDIYSRLLRGSYDMSEGRSITFQIVLFGKSPGAMEFDYSCSPNSLKGFWYERIIPMPTSGGRTPADPSDIKFQKYKKIAASYYCDNFSSLLISDRVSLDNGNQIYSPRLESKQRDKDTQTFTPQKLMTCLGARAMKDLINGNPAYFCVDVYRSKGWLSYPPVDWQ